MYISVHIVLYVCVCVCARGLWNVAASASVGVCMGVCTKLCIGVSTEECIGVCMGVCTIGVLVRVLCLWSECVLERVCVCGCLCGSVMLFC